MEQDRLMTAGELAEYLSVPRGSIYNMVYERRIPHIKLGRRVRFRRDEIDRWLEERRVEAIER